MESKVLEVKRLCACGCKTVISEKRSDGRPKFYVYGHNRKNGHFPNQVYGLTRAETHGMWKGGRMIANGYVLVRCEEHPRAYYRGMYVLEHVLVYERHHKCCMLRWGIVHHINENRSDNRIENLQGMSRSKHISLHHKGKSFNTWTTRRKNIAARNRSIVLSG
jgi:hypothetical protein